MSMTSHWLKAPTFLGIAAIMIASPAHSACPDCPGPAPSPVCSIEWEGGKYQERPKVVTGCVASVIANWNQGNSDTCNASVPQGTALIDIIPSELSSNNGSWSVSRYTAGHLKYSQSIDDTYSSLYDIALKLGDKNYAATIKQDWDRHKKIAEQYDSNTDSARVNVSAHGSGNWYDQWRGWETAKVDLKVICLAPANLTEQLLKALSFDNYAKKSELYVSVYNDTGNKVYGLLQPLPIGKARCTDASGRSSPFTIEDKTQQNFRVNDYPGKLENKGVCVVLGKTAEPGYSSFSKACEVNTATLTNLSDVNLAACYVN
jgi:hypothetical protein